MTITNKQGNEGNFQEGARVPEKDVLGRTWGVNRNAEAADQGGGAGEEELQGASEFAGELAAFPIKVASQYVGAASEVLGQMMSPPGKETDDSALAGLPMSVSHSDLVAASKKYGTDWWGK